MLLQWNILRLIKNSNVLRLSLHKHLTLKKSLPTKSPISGPTEAPSYNLTPDNPSAPVSDSTSSTADLSEILADVSLESLEQIVEELMPAKNDQVKDDESKVLPEQTLQGNQE